MTLNEDLRRALLEAGFSEEVLEAEEWPTWASLCERALEMANEALDMGEKLREERDYLRKRLSEIATH